MPSDDLSDSLAVGVRAPPQAACALAVDFGGTASRWALVAADGGVRGQGDAAALAAQAVGTPTGRAALEALVAPVLPTLGEASGCGALVAGITGLDPAHAPWWTEQLASVTGIQPACVVVRSDIEMACRACLEPGHGTLLYAGTGAIAGHLDGQGCLQRVGGRGVQIDDAGGGHWIATRALRSVWRAEDAHPGAWRQSLLAQAVFDRIGGPDWAATRRFLASAGRGQVGELALAVAQVADRDGAAMALLQAAGRELARLCRVSDERFGPQPLVLAGRVWALHPVLQLSLRQALPAGRTVSRLEEPLVLAAARRAARGGPC